MEEPDAEITAAMENREQEKESTEQDKPDYLYVPWSPQYNIPGVDEFGNPERPYSPQHTNCSLCRKRGSLYIVKGRVQRMILAIGLFLSGRQQDIEIIELTQEKQFITGPRIRDWRKVSIHVDRMIAVARKLKEFYVGPNSIGSRIIHSLSWRLFVDPEIEFGSMETAIDFFIEVFTGDLDTIRRRGNATMNNCLNEKDEYEFYRVLKLKNPEHAQCLLCGRIADKKNFVDLIYYQDTFSFCIYASPLVSNLMTTDQAYIASDIGQIFVCEEHTHEMAKWLKLFIEKNLHDKRTMKALEDAADIMIFEKSLLKGIEALHVFITKYIPSDPRPLEICHYCKKQGPNVFYDELFCLSAHDNCHRENAKNILAKLNCDTPEEIERLPIELLFPAFDKLVHFLPIVKQRKAEKRTMNTDEMKILLYVLMVRYFDPKGTRKIREKLQIDPNLYYGETPELPKPYAPPTSLPDVSQGMIRFELPNGGYCPTEDRPRRWLNELMIEPIKKRPLTSAQIEEKNRIRQRIRERKEEQKKRQLEKEKREFLRKHTSSEHAHFFTDEYLAKVDKMQAEEKARKLAEQAAGTAQPEDEKMEVDNDQMPSTSDAAATAKEDILPQTIDTLEPAFSEKTECQTSQPDGSGTSTDAFNPSSQPSSRPQQLDLKKRGHPESQSMSSERPSEPKIPRLEPEEKHQRDKQRQSSSESTKLGSIHTHGNSSTSEGSSHQSKNISHEEASGKSEKQTSNTAEKQKSYVFEYATGPTSSDIGGSNPRLEKLRREILSRINTKNTGSSERSRLTLMPDFDEITSNFESEASDSRSRKTKHEELSKTKLNESNSSEKTKPGLIESNPSTSDSKPESSDFRSRKSKHEEASKLVSRKSEPPGNRLEKSRSSDSGSRQSDVFKVPSIPSIQKPSTSAMLSQPSKTPNPVIMKHSNISEEPQIPASKKRGSESMETGPIVKKSEIGTPGHISIKEIRISGPITNEEIRTPGPKSKEEIDTPCPIPNKKDRTPDSAPNKEIRTSGPKPVKGTSIPGPVTSNEIRTLGPKPKEEISTPIPKPNKEVSIPVPKPNQMKPTSDEMRKDRSQSAESSRHSIPPSMPPKSDEPHETLAEKLMKSFKIPLITGARKPGPSSQSFESIFGPGSKPVVNEKSNDKGQHHDNGLQRQEKQRLPSDSRGRQQSVDRQQPISSSMSHASRMSMPPPEKPYTSQFSQPVAHQRHNAPPSLSHSRERASSEKPLVVPTNPGTSSLQEGIPSGQQQHRMIGEQKQEEHKKQPSQPPFSRAVSVPRILQTQPVPSHRDTKKAEARPTMPDRNPMATTPVKPISTALSAISKPQPGARAHSVSRQSSNLKILTGLSQSTPSLVPSSSTPRKSIPSLMDIDPAARRSIPSLMDTELAPLRPGTSPTPLGSVRPVSGPIPAPISSLLGPIPPPGPPPFTPGVAPPNYRQGPVPPSAATKLFGAPGLLGAAPSTMQYEEPGLMPPGVSAVQYGASLVRQGSRPPHRILQPWEIKAEPQDTGYPDARNARNVTRSSQQTSSHRQGQNISSEPHRRSSAAATSLELQLLLPPPPIPPVLTPVGAPATARSSSTSNKVFQMRDIKKELPDDGYNSSRQGNQPSSSSQRVSRDDQRPRQSSQRPTSSQPTVQPRGPSQPRPTPGKESVPTTSRSNPLYQRKSFAKQLTEEEIAANRLRHQGIPLSASLSSKGAREQQQQPSTSSALSSSLKRPSGIMSQKPGDVTKARKNESQSSRLPAPPKPPPILPPFQPAKMKAPAEIKQEIFDEMNQPK